VPVEPPHDDPGWHFSEAIADKAISWISQQKAGAPDKPFFLYFAPGRLPQPASRRQEWADKYKGKFDHGWDRQREIAFEKQKKLGLVPKGTQLTRARLDSVVGVVLGGREASLRADAGGLRRLPRAHRCPDRQGSSTRSRPWACATTR
jgi:arylsulfatase A-like enzyme